MNKERGFTMIELMITLAIVGLVASLALPSYRDVIRKSNRTDARITLSRLVTLQERHYLGNNRYSEDFAELVAGAATGALLASDEGHYSIALALTGDGTGWSLMATATGAQADDTQCLSFMLTSIGTKTALNSDGAANPDCW